MLKRTQIININNGRFNCTPLVKSKFILQHGSILLSNLGIQLCHDTTSMWGLPAIWSLGITRPTSQHRNFKYMLSFLISFMQRGITWGMQGSSCYIPASKSARVIVEYAHTGAYNQVKWDRNRTHYSRKYCGKTVLDFVVQIQAFWIIHVSTPTLQ